jgi:Uncharacterized protein conserved in bacteria
MSNNITNWTRLAANGQYSTLGMAKLLYPDGSSKKLFNRYKFMVRSLLYRQELKRMYFLFREPLLKLLPDKYPELLDKPLRPYQFARSKASERARMIEEHYHLLSTLFPNTIIPLYLAEGITLGEFPTSPYRIVLRYDGTFRREGELAISILNEHGFRLYSCAFSFAGTIHQLALVIGSVQGPDPIIENATKIVRTMTKELHGLRPKSLVVALVLMLARIINADQVRAVKNSAHVFQAKRYSKKQKLKFQADYEELWSEFNSKELNDHFVQLTQPERKTLEEIASKKRAMYRRRHEWLDEIEKNINTFFHTPDTSNTDVSPLIA